MFRRRKNCVERQDYEKLRPTGAIWVEKSARLRNLIILVIFPVGLKFSATFRRKISEFDFLSFNKLFNNCDYFRKLCFVYVCSKMSFIIILMILGFELIFNKQSFRNRNIWVIPRSKQCYPFSIILNFVPFPWFIKVSAFLL